METRIPVAGGSESGLLISVVLVVVARIPDAQVGQLQVPIIGPAVVCSLLV